MTPDSNPPAAGDARAPGRFSVVVHAGVHVIMLSRREVLDTFAVGAIQPELIGYIQQLEEPRVVIDLGAISFISSAGLSLLISAGSAATSRGGQLRLAQVPDDLLGMFRSTRPDRLFEIHPSTDAAVQSLA